MVNRKFGLTQVAPTHFATSTSNLAQASDARLKGGTSELEHQQHSQNGAAKGVQRGSQRTASSSIARHGGPQYQLFEILGTS